MNLRNKTNESVLLATKYNKMLFVNIMMTQELLYTLTYLIILYLTVTKQIDEPFTLFNQFCLKYETIDYLYKAFCAPCDIYELL